MPVVVATGLLPASSRNFAIVCCPRDVARATATTYSFSRAFAIRPNATTTYVTLSKDNITTCGLLPARAGLNLPVYSGLVVIAAERSPRLRPHWTKGLFLSAGDELKALASCKTFVSRSSHETQRKKYQRQPRGGIEPPSTPE